MPRGRTRSSSESKHIHNFKVISITPGAHKIILTDLVTAGSYLCPCSPCHCVSCSLSETSSRVPDSENQTQDSLWVQEKMIKHAESLKLHMHTEYKFTIQFVHH